MTNYINNTNLFKTGFLPDNNTLRIKQGLEPQIVNNSCNNQTPQNISQNMTQNMTQNIRQIITENIQKPNQVKWNYGTPEIPNDCPCVQYLF